MQRELWRIEKNTKIAAIDIDGVLCSYPDYWVEWLNKETGNTFKNLNEAKENLKFAQYKKLKIKYRESGEELNVPVKPEATHSIKTLQENGYKVILLTTRPYRKHRRLWNDTIDWLNKHEIKPDGLIFEEEKHWAVLKEFPYTAFMVEDNAEIANQVAKLGYKVYLVDNQYNRQCLEKNVSRVNNLLEVIKNEVIQ